MTLADLAKLVSHDWPMSYIVINSMPEESVKDILEAFAVTSIETRLYCRSVHCIGKPFDNTPEGVHFL